MSYFNTTAESGGQLIQSKSKALAQDERILEFFKEHPNQKFTPDEILDSLFTSVVPITSVRRSITNLTIGLFLSKTEDMRMGRYGKLTHTWTLKMADSPQLKLL